jgi:two-component system KDP operon response regulator KdpE
MTKASSNILIIDDDFSFRHVLRTTLSTFGFHVEEAATGEQGVALTRNGRFDAALLDINMPGMGGLVTCHELRRISPVLQILVLTVRDSQDDIVRALDAGADDYITKPFHTGELAARLRAATRRNRSTIDPDRPLIVGEIELEPAKRTVRKRGALVHTTPTEFDLLHQLMLFAGMPVTHAKLLRVVWGPEYGGELEYLRTFIRQLRLKIEDDPSNPSYLLTEPYLGYRFGQSAPQSQPLS